MLPYHNSMKPPDLEKIRSEKQLSTTDFLQAYNEDLPKAFPRATLPLLEAFQKTYPGLFKNKETWTLGQHRKKVMDWLPQHIELTQK